MLRPPRARLAHAVRSRLLRHFRRASFRSCLPPPSPSPLSQRRWQCLPPNSAWRPPHPSQHMHTHTPYGGKVPPEAAVGVATPKRRRGLGNRDGRTADASPTRYPVLPTGAFQSERGCSNQNAGVPIRTWALHSGPFHSAAGEGGWRQPGVVRCDSPRSTRATPARPASAAHARLSLRPARISPLPTLPPRPSCLKKRAHRFSSIRDCPVLHLELAGSTGSWSDSALGHQPLLGLLPPRPTLPRAARAMPPDSEPTRAAPYHVHGAVVGSACGQAGTECVAHLKS